MGDLGEGVVFAGHRIEGVAGRGGMGTVYRATHLALDHMVALKVIAADLAGDDSFRDRFKSESRIAVSLRHPNVVPIHHAGEEDGLLFVTMDLIPGPDLRKLLIERGPLEPEEAIAILEQVASALDVAHSRGLVHRDIKPGNVLIEDRPGGEHAYLTDFGLTKRMDQASGETALTSTGAFVGTLDYVAPEQIRGEDLDARTDVYALGCVLYETLAGSAPFSDREEKVAKMYAHLQDQPERLQGELAAFNDVIARAIAKEREDRFPSAGDLARSAAAALGGGVVEAERSVATGPAAPTEIHESIGEGPEPAAAASGGAGGTLEPTVEATTPPAAERTMESVAQVDEPEVESPAAGADAEGRTAAGAPPTRVERRASGVAAEGDGGGRRTAGLIAAMLAAAAAIGGGVLVLGGGDDSSPSTSTTTSQGNGPRQGDPVPELLTGGVPGGELPVGTAVDDGVVYAVDREGMKVLQGSAESFESVGPPLPTGAPPEDAIVDSGSVWITVPKAGQVLRASPNLEPVGAPIAVGTDPSGITSGSGSIWVTNQGSGDVSEIDPSAGTVSRTIPTSAGRPHGITVDGGSLWVVDRSGGRLLRLNRSTGAEEAAVAVGNNPKGVAVANGVVWVANADSGTVSLIDASDNTEIDTISVSGQPRAVDVFDGKVWVSNGDEESLPLGQKKGWVSVFDAKTRKPIDKKLIVGGSPEGLGVGAGRVWVATGPENEVRAIDPG